MKGQYLKLAGIYLIFYILMMIKDSNGMSGLWHLIDFSNKHILYISFTSILSIFSYTLLSYAVLLFFYKRDKKILAWIGVILILPFGVFIRYFLEEIIGTMIFGSGNYAPEVGLSYYFRDNTYYGQIFLVLGVAYFFVQKSSYEEKKRSQLIIEQKKSELLFLKSQINPHFLFNTLNNIYALVNKNAPNSLAVIEKLSQLLRYTLYESKNKVSISKELKMLDDFTELHNLRVKNGIQIQKNIDIENDNHEIAPLILLPFLENTIKHGIINDPNTPVIMDMSLSKSELNFSLKNKISKLEKDEVGGIGLDNIKKRLMLLYPKKHHLKMKTEDGYFVVKLSIIFE